MMKNIWLQTQAILFDYTGKTKEYWTILMTAITAYRSAPFPVFLKKSTVEKNYTKKNNKPKFFLL